MTRVLILILSVLMLGGCVGGTRSSFALQDRQGARPMGLVSDERHPIRVYLDDERRIALFRQAFHDGVPVGEDGVVDFLTLSGGGSNGAFTAGLMRGWTESGNRPDFEVVTGVSTGALAAPFVFLGSDWDDELEEAYTGGAASSLLQSQGLGVL
ncbi:MAG: patatin-like phospholipase family protein, partial [Brevundimonas sp.]